LGYAKTEWIQCSSGTFPGKQQSGPIADARLFGSKGAGGTVSLRTTGVAARRRSARLGLPPEVRVCYGWPLLPPFCSRSTDRGGTRPASTAAQGSTLRPDPRLRAGLRLPGLSRLCAAAVPGPLEDGWYGSGRASHGVAQRRNLPGHLNDLPTGSGIHLEP